MANLLEETLERMKGVGLGPEDIVFIGSADNEYSMAGWREFRDLADVEYDDGYGAPEVATDLEIWFQDGTYFVRAEYDGSEWWDAVIPRANQESSTKRITRLIVSPKEIGWMTLAEMAKADGAGVDE